MDLENAKTSDTQTTDYQNSLKSINQLAVFRSKKHLKPDFWQKRQSQFLAYQQWSVVFQIQTPINENMLLKT